MQDLHLVGVHDDSRGDGHGEGRHLMLADEQGRRYRLRADETLRSALSSRTPALQTQMQVGDALSAREVQALIRSGLEVDEVAERAGWPSEKVERFAGPIIAEREHISSLALGQRVRDHGEWMPTLQTRVGERLAARGVDAELAGWTAYRGESGPWTLAVSFPAGGKDRRATWHFDLADRRLTALDDEARWLSEDESAAGPLPGHRPAPADARSWVYDVEAEGGLQVSQRPQESGPQQGRDRPMDLMTAMRERSLVRGRRRGSSRRGNRNSPTDLPGAAGAPVEALPLDDLATDPGLVAPPPAGSRGEPAEPGASVSTGGADADGGGGRAAERGGGVAYGEHDRPPRERMLELPIEEGVGRDDGEADKPVGPDTPAVGNDPERAPQGDSAGQVGTTPESTPATAPEPAATLQQPPEAEAGAVPPAAHRVAAYQADPPEPNSSEDAEPVTPARAPKAPRRRGRPSVPSWDDVMFGTRPGEHT